MYCKQMTAETNNFSTDLNTTRIMPLEHVCCYEVGGEDAQSFLQSQLTNDVDAVTRERGQLSSYCTPKGRMLAIFHICRLQEKFLIIVREDIAETVMQRLKMFVLRAKVTIERSSLDRAVFGIVGPDAGTVLATLNLATPAKDYDVADTDNSLCMKIPGIVPRYIFIGGDPSAAIAQTLKNEHIETGNRLYWQWLDIMSGIPSVNAATQESFVPQMTNLELIDGVSFSKGCYPGQEIVARLHYLGNASRRMYRIEASADSDIIAGADIYQPEAESAQAIGNIVTAVKEASNRTAALAVLRIEAAQGKQLAVGSPNGPPATIMPLPYDIPTEQTQ